MRLALLGRVLVSVDQLKQWTLPGMLWESGCTDGLGSVGSREFLVDDVELRSSLTAKQKEATNEAD